MKILGRDIHGMRVELFKQPVDRFLLDHLAAHRIYIVVVHIVDHLFQLVFLSPEGIQLSCPVPEEYAQEDPPAQHQRKPNRQIWIILLHVCSLVITGT